MNEWTVIAILFSFVVLAAGIGALCDKPEPKAGDRGRKP
jgi:hypothetical protein